MSEQNRKPEAVASASVEPAADTGPEASRRQLLKRMGLAAAVAPAMVVLLEGESKATPACDNPAWDLGLKRKGHSGC